MRSPDARQSLALFAPTRNPFTAALLVLSLIPDVIWLGGLAEEGMEAAERDRLFEERLRNAASQDQAPRAQAPPSAPLPRRRLRRARLPRGRLSNCRLPRSRATWSWAVMSPKCRRRVGSGRLRRSNPASRCRRYGLRDRMNRTS
jgi:hypothetical protein